MRQLIWYYAALFIAPAIMAGASAEAETISFRLDASKLEQRGQLRQAIFARDANAIRLKDMVLVEDDAPGIGKPKGATDRSWFEKLHEGVVIRKDLVLDDPRAFSAWLLFNGTEAKDNDVPLSITVNGHHCIRPPSKTATPFARQYYTRDWGGDQFDNWFFVEIPAGALVRGTNEIVLKADSPEPGWEIMVADAGEFAGGSDTRATHPNRSAKSRDGGRTWDFNRLGWKDAHDGEYCIRLSLDRSVSEGGYVSPVIDIADTSSGLAIKRLVTLRSCRLQWDIETPGETGAAVRYRTGESPVPSANGWSPWVTAKGLSATLDNPRGRYLQFDVTMTAPNPLETPVIRGIAVETVFDEREDASPVMCRIAGGRNGCVIRPSVEYVHEDFGKMKDYAEKFELDKVLEGPGGEFAAQLRLLRWAYEIPIATLDPYAWNYYDLPILKRGSDENILMQTYEGRRRDKHCLYSNLTLVGACLSVGFPARWVNIATRSTYGHEVVEVWSNEFNKWIFLDATRDYYIYDPDTGIPMSLIEINERLGEIMPASPNWEYPIRWMVKSDSLAYSARVAFREGNNRFSINDINQGPHLLMLKGQLHISLRNDFASRQTPVPWRVSSNWGGPLFYGFYTDIFPRKREYSLHTNRPQDFSPPLNQSELTVSKTARPGVLRIDIDTETPCFETFVADIDGSGWMAFKGATLEWPLHEGLNTLRVKAKNTMGITGPESSVRVVMNR